MAGRTILELVERHLDLLLPTSSVKIRSIGLAMKWKNQGADGRKAIGVVGQRSGGKPSGDLALQPVHRQLHLLPVGRYIELRAGADGDATTGRLADVVAYPRDDDRSRLVFRDHLLRDGFDDRRREQTEPVLAKTVSDGKA